MPSKPMSAIVSAAVLAVVVMTVSGPALARELSWNKYAQEPRAIMALAIAVQELGDCEGDLTFFESDPKDGSTDTVLVTVMCEAFPADKGKTAKASVVIEMGVDEKKHPIGPTSFEYNLP